MRVVSQFARRQHFNRRKMLGIRAALRLQAGATNWKLKTFIETPLWHVISGNLLMKNPLLVKAIGIAALGSLLGAGCVVRERVGYAGEVEVDTEPPPLQVETIPPTPGPAFVWIGGVWVWGGGGWHWQGGHYERPPHPGAVWVPHRYAYRNGHRVFVRGGWR